MGWTSTDEQLESAYLSSSESLEPRTYKETITSEEAELWQSAIKEEYDSLLKNGTWILTDLPADRVAIKNRWLFKVKPAYKDTAAR